MSIHHMRDYVEMHAVLLKSPDEGVHIARSGDGDVDLQTYKTACALAEMMHQP